MDLTYCKNQLYLIQELWKVIDVIYSLIKGKGLENQGTLKLNNWRNTAVKLILDETITAIIAISVRNVFVRQFQVYFITYHCCFFVCFFFTEERREFGLYTHRSHTYPLSRSGLISCTRAGIIGKARIRTLKMTLVIGKSYTVVTLHCRVISFFHWFYGYIVPFTDKF